MRKCARAIVIKDGQILLMERHKMGQHYYTLPGGTVEPNETPDQAALREVKEETSLVVANPRLVFIEDSGTVFGDQYVYTCDYVSGEPYLPPESEEQFWTIPGKNTYNPLWYPVDKLADVPFVSILLKEALLMALKHGFPKEPFQFSSKHSQRLS